jgi:hypothetical protein
MQTENLTLYEGGKRKIIEKVCKILPDVSISVLPQAFVIKTIDLSNLPTLVIPS